MTNEEKIKFLEDLLATVKSNPDASNVDLQALGDIGEIEGGKEESPESSSLIDSRFKVDNLIKNYLIGLDLRDNEGNEFPESLYYHHLNAAIQYTCRLLNIVITPVELEERHDYYNTDFSNWGYMSLYKKPAISVESIQLMYGNKSVTSIPSEWIRVSKMSSTLQLFPTEGSSSALIITGDGRLLQVPGYWDNAPQLWNVKYKAGFEGELPFDLMDFIYKRAAVNVLTIWGDLIGGAGIANASISIDGLSQSYGTTKSAGANAASARCNMYNEDMKNSLNVLKSTYDPMRLAVI